MENRGGYEEAASWPGNNSSSSNSNKNRTVCLEKLEEMGVLSTFKSMLEVENEDWYLTSNNLQSQHDPGDLSFTAANFAEAESNILLQPVDSSASCSPSSVSMFNGLDPSQVQYFLPQKPPSMQSVLNAISSNPLENSFDLGFDGGFLEPQQLMNRGASLLAGFTCLSSQQQMGMPNLSSEPQFSTTHLLPLPGNDQKGYSGFGFWSFEERSGDGMFLNRFKSLKPLENFDSIASQPTLFQKRAALNRNLADNGANLGVLGGGSSNNAEGHSGKVELNEVNEKKIKNSNGGDVEDLSVDGSSLNYHSDDFMESNKVEESTKNGGNCSNANSTVTGGDQKGKKKGLPAKNLMAERRRRKKLNDRLYMLRSVVPRISKMDRASILGDTVEYLKELLQKINDLHNELESAPPGSSLTPNNSASFYPLTPTPRSLPNCIKEELCSSSLPSPNAQHARIEVRAREGRAVNIHMFCGCRPGLLLSTMRALDNLGLDIQQAVVSCFNGFAMDIFRAELCREGQDVHPDQIKAVLLDSTGLLA